MAKKIQKEADCPLAPALAVFAGQWKPEILWHVGAGGAKRFGEIRRLIPAVSPKMLTQQLKQLERDGLVTRTQYQEIPPRVEYAVTDLYRTLVPVLGAIHKWGVKESPRIKKAREAFDRNQSRAVAKK